MPKAFPYSLRRRPLRCSRAAGTTKERGVDRRQRVTDGRLRLVIAGDQPPDTLHLIAQLNVLAFCLLHVGVAVKHQ